MVQSSNSERATDDFVILSKNVRGLTNDDRLEELEAELSLVKGWDIVVLTETWRKSTNEYFETLQGNIFMNCGCTAGRRRVGFVVHKKWAASIQEFVAMNE